MKYVLWLYGIIISKIDISPVGRFPGRRQFPKWQIQQLEYLKNHLKCSSWYRNICLWSYKIQTQYHFASLNSSSHIYIYISAILKTCRQQDNKYEYT